MKLHAQIQGEGPPLVLLHGWGFSHRVWHNVVSLLSSRYQVINLDLPGFGQSAFNNSLCNLKTFSEALLNEIPNDSILMGWSLGGLVAQYLAIHFPEKVKALIAVTSSPCFIKQVDWPGMSESLIRSFANELMTNYQKILQRFLLLQFFGTEVDRKIIQQLSHQIIEEPPCLEALQLGLDLLLSNDLRQDLNKINCPTHFIFGKLDVIVPASVAEALTQLNKTMTTTIISGAGHAPFISHPEIFLDSTGLLL